MMKIYGFPTFNVTKVLLTAEELGLPYEYVALDPTRGEHKSPEHMQRHPLGQVPVLEHEDNFYTESATICRYLARISDSKLYDGDVRQKAAIDRWIDFGTLHMGKALTTYFFQEIVSPNFFGGETDRQAIAEANELLSQQLPIADQQLAETRFLTGDELTIADLIVFSFIQIHEVTSAEIDAYPNLARWYAEIRARPSFAGAMQHYPGNNLFG